MGEGKEVESLGKDQGVKGDIRVVGGGSPRHLHGIP